MSRKRRAGRRLLVAGNEDLLIATRGGQAIRFAEQLVARTRLSGHPPGPRRTPAAITPVDDDGVLFLLAGDGKGALRQISSFRANKAPGAGGQNDHEDRRTGRGLATVGRESISS